MNRHCIQCKNFVQHYSISESLQLWKIYKTGHCKEGMIKDCKPKICKEWILSDEVHIKNKEKHKLKSTINRIHDQLDELVLVYKALTKDNTIQQDKS